MKIFAVILACVAALAATPVSADESALSKREKRMSSKEFQQLCDRFGVSDEYQSEAALAGEEPKALCKLPPSYPQKCARNAKEKESVTLVYDITPDGYTENIRLVETTNECLVQAAINAVLYYNYEKSENGAKDIETTSEFTLLRR